MSLLSEFFLGTPSTIRQLDLLELSHPNFTQTYRIVRNAQKRLSTPGAVGIPGITHEDSTGPHEYTYCPFQLKPVGSGSDLTQSLAITMGDLGTIIRKEIAAVTAANKMAIRPTVKFRTYRSDDLSEPISGPLVLEIKDVTRTEEGASFAAIAPLLNNSRTGVLYTVEQFPMLRGFF